MIKLVIGEIATMNPYKCCQWIHPNCVCMHVCCTNQLHLVFLLCCCCRWWWRWCRCCGCSCYLRVFPFLLLLMHPSFSFILVHDFAHFIYLTIRNMALRSLCHTVLCAMLSAMCNVHIISKTDAYAFNSTSTSILAYLST